MAVLDLDRTARYVPRIDWDGDGDYDLPSEDLAGRWLGDEGIQVQSGRDQARALAPPMIDQADFTLNNADRGFSPENPASGAYQLMRPGRTTMIAVQWGLSNSQHRKHRAYRSAKPYRGRGEWPIFTGVTASLAHDPSLGRWSVGISAVGALASIRQRRISTALYENMRTDQCVGVILDTIGWPAGKRQIATGDTTLLYWWLDEENAWDALMQLVASEGAGAALLSDGAGNLIFQNRNYRTINTRSVVSQATFSDTFTGHTYYRKHLKYRSNKRFRGFENRLYYARITYDPSYDNIVNRCSMNAVQRSYGSTQVVWQYGSSLVIAAGATEQITVHTSDPFRNALVPVAGTDYLVLSGSVSGVTLSQTSGAVATIAITAGGGGATIGGLQLRAQPLQVISEIVIKNTSDQSASIAKFGEVAYQVDARSEIEIHQGQAVVNAVPARYATERPIIEITVPNYDAEHMRTMLGLRVSDRITVINNHLGLTAGAEMFIERIRHNISESGQIHEVIFGCERATSIQGAVWDVSLWDALAAVWGS